MIEPHGLQSGFHFWKPTFRQGCFNAQPHLQIRFPKFLIVTQPAGYDGFTLQFPRVLFDSAFGQQPLLATPWWRNFTSTVNLIVHGQKPLPVMLDLFEWRRKKSYV